MASIIIIIFFNDVTREKFLHFHCLTLFKVSGVTFCRGNPFCRAPSVLPPRSLYRFPAGLPTCTHTRTHTQHAAPLGSGHILPPAVRLRRLTSPHLPFSSSPSSFLLAAPPHPCLRRGTGVWCWGGVGGHVMTEVSAWVTVILSAIVPTGPGESMHSSPRPPSPSICPVVALWTHIPAHQELLLSGLAGVQLHRGRNGKEVRVNAPLFSDPSSSPLSPALLIAHCVACPPFCSFYLPVRDPFRPPRRLSPL